MSADLLILGASARAAAFSALRAGLRPTCGDLFADRDLAAVADVQRVEPSAYPDDFEAVAAASPPAPWIYTGALENHPELVDRLAAARPLWGIRGDALRAVRDPFVVAKILETAGLPCPAVRATADGLPRDGSWLAKPRASAGGIDIAAVGPHFVESNGASYYQERIVGPSSSAVFLGDRAGAGLIGVTMQLLGRRGAPFAYRGSVGPCPPRVGVEGRINALGLALARAFGLVGLFGVDFVLKGSVPWPVEVNPRLTASAEVLELALGRPLLAEHRRACDATATPTGAEPAGGPLHRIVGKAIVFAEAPCRFPDGVEWSLPDLGAFEVPEIADVPHAGATFESGEPVLTVFATGDGPRTCQERLSRAVTRWQRRLRPIEPNARPRDA